MIAYLILIPALIWASVSDIRTRMIPDTVHALILTSGAVLIFGYGQPWEPRVIALLLVGIMTLMLSLCVTGIGGGDVKMMAAIAFALGFSTGLYSLIIAMISALIYMFIRLGMHKHKKESVPLAPFLSIGCIAALVIQRFYPEKFMEMI